MIIYGAFPEFEAVAISCNFDSLVTDYLDVAIYKVNPLESDVIVNSSEFWDPYHGNIYREGLYKKKNNRLIPESELEEDYDGEIGYVYDVYEKGKIIEEGKFDPLF